MRLTTKQIFWSEDSFTGFQRIIMVLYLAFAVLAFPEMGLALEYRTGWAFFDAFFKENNYLKTASDAASEPLITDDTYAILGAYPYVGLDFNAHFSAYFQPGFEWTHSWDAEDSEDWDSDVISAVVSYASPAFSADLGVQSFRPGKGLISYNDEPGVSLQFHGPGRVYIKGDLFQVLDTSPMAMLTFGYRPGFLETVEVFGAGFHDADDALADLFTPFFDGADMKTSGDLYWIGAMADIFIKKAYVSGLWIQQFGTVDMERSSVSDEMDVSAFLMDVEISYPVLAEVSASAFLFIARGDSRPVDDRLTAFVSPMPFNDRTAIFFNGGFARYDVEEKVSLGGVMWDGVIAPGIGIDYQPVSEIVTKLTAALLFPENHSKSRDDWYGWETDARVTYEFYLNQKVFAEAGVLVHGNYWKERAGYRPDPSARLAAGLDLAF